MVSLGALARKVLGSSNDRRLKAMRPHVEAINALEGELQALSDADLAALADAWDVAGADGVRVIDEDAWIPAVVEMVAARDLVTSVSGPHASIQVRGNRITVGGTEQYRLSRDGRWYRFEKIGGRWTLADGSAPTVDDLLADAEDADS